MMITGWWFSIPLKNLKVSWGYYSQIWNNKTCSKPPPDNDDNDYDLIISSYAQ